MFSCEYCQTFKNTYLEEYLPTGASDQISIAVRGGFRIAAASRMEHFVIIVNGLQPLTIITKRFILNVAAVLDPPLAADYILKNVSEFVEPLNITDIQIPRHIHVNTKYRLNAIRYTR